MLVTLQAVQSFRDKNDTQALDAEIQRLCGQMRSFADSLDIKLSSSEQGEELNAYRPGFYQGRETRPTDAIIDSLNLLVSEAGRVVSKLRYQQALTGRRQEGAAEGSAPASDRTQMHRLAIWDATTNDWPCFVFPAPISHKQNHRDFLKLVMGLTEDFRVQLFVSTFRFSDDEVIVSLRKSPEHGNWFKALMFHPNWKLLGNVKDWVGDSCSPEHLALLDSIGISHKQLEGIKNNRYAPDSFEVRKRRAELFASINANHSIGTEQAELNLAGCLDQMYPETLTKE